MADMCHARSTGTLYFNISALAMSLRQLPFASALSSTRTHPLRGTKSSEKKSGTNRRRRENILVAGTNHRRRERIYP
eukprot:6473975-Pyramimonas_sp.AAC.1